MNEHGNGGSTAVMRREGFGGRDLVAPGETASTAVAAQAKAQTEARYIMAWKNPRDMDDVRVRLLKECKRPGFADAAWYKLPRSGNPEGFTIRFAEAAARCMGNLLCETTTTYDDHEKRIVKVCVTDLESNTTYPRDVTISKTVERSSVKEGQSALGERVNSRGQKTYILAANEDDLLNKEGALISKTLRTLILRLVPGDIQDEAEALILETMKSRSKTDPDAERKKIADAFAAIGVMPADLKAYLGQDVASLSPPQLDELRKIHAAIKTGETSWKDLVASKKEAEPDSAPATSSNRFTAPAAKVEPLHPEPEQAEPPKDAPKPRATRTRAASPPKESTPIDEAHRAALELINQGDQQKWLSDGAVGGYTDKLAQLRKNSDLEGIKRTITELEIIRDNPPTADAEENWAGVE